MSADTDTHFMKAAGVPNAGLLEKDAFVGLGGATHLCTGGESPWLRRHDAVYARFREAKSAGGPGRKKVFDDVEQCRSRIASLWDVNAERISFRYSSADAMNSVARGLSWRHGDNVVTPAVEFPSVGFAWQHLVDHGVQLRRVASDNWIIDEDALLNAVDDRTRVLAVSQVSYYTGQALDIRKLAEGLSGSTTLLAVDATHASGVINTFAADADIHMSSSYKWMLGTTGVAPCYISERAEQALAATVYGWRNLNTPKHGSSAELDGSRAAPLVDMPRRYEAGNPSVVPILFLNSALATLLDIGIDSIERHARSLSGSVAEMLRDIGISPISPPANEQRSGNTCFLHDDAEVLTAKLAEENVLLWGDNGRVRVSTHLYNDLDDVEQLRTSLCRCLNK